MATAPILNLEQLLQDIPGNSPAGSDLSKDDSPTALLRTLRDAADAARSLEKKLIEGKSTEVPKWAEVLQKARDGIAGKAKDLKLAQYLAEALVRTDGFGGLRDGLRLIRLLVESFWERNLFPASDKEGLRSRIQPILSLCGDASTTGVLINAISLVPLTESTADGGPFGRLHYQQGAQFEADNDPERKARRIREWEERELKLGRLAPTLARFTKVMAASKLGFLKSCMEDIAQCLDECSQLAAVVGKKCEGAKDASGGPLVLSTGQVARALSECQVILEGFARERLKQVEGKPVSSNVTEAEGGEGTGAREDSGLGAGQITSREAALDTIRKVAEFFKRTEPLSPIWCDLERVVRWGSLSFPGLMKELLAENEAARKSVFDLVGYQPAKDEESKS